MPRSVLRTFAAVAAIALPAVAQNSQSLPNGWLNTDATSSSAFPVNDQNSHKWQWHYDSSNFVATGPIVVTEIWVRASAATATIAAFNFPSWDVTLASSPTDYSVAGNGVQPGHSTTFAANLNPDATLVRTGPWVGGPVPPSGGTTATWVPMGLTGQFMYDPTLGNDFVVQIDKCGSVATWATSIDGATGGAGAVLGNRYGTQTACGTLVSTFSNNEFVPVVKIDYLEDNRLTVSQSGPGVGDLSMSLVGTTAGAIEGWILLSADVSHPASSGPALGIYPDLTTWSILFGTPIADGNPLHFFIPSQLGLFPNVPFQVPPGGVSFLAGLTFDFTGAVFGPGPVYLGRMNVVRHTFL